MEIVLKILSCVIIFALYNMFMRIFLEARHNSWIFTSLAIIIPSLLLFHINLLRIPLLNTITTFILCIALACSCFNAHPYQKIIIGIIAPAIELICEFSVIVLDSLIMKKNIAESTTNALFKTSYIYLSTGLFCVISVLMWIVMQNKKKRYNEYKLTPNSTMVIIPLFSVILLYILLYFSVQLPEEVGFQKAFVPLLIGLLAMNIILIVTEKQAYEKNQLYLDYLAMENQVKLNEMLIMQQQENIESLSSKAHDYAKVLSTLRQYLMDTYGNNETIIGIIGQEIERNSVLYLFHTYHSKTLTAIVRDFQTKCEKHNILFIPQIQFEQIDFISFTDLCTLLCNVLDNALNASIKYLKEQKEETEIVFSIFRKTKWCIYRLLTNICLILKGLQKYVARKNELPMLRELE